LKSVLSETGKSTSPACMYRKARYEHIDDATRRPGDTR
jgi:hypothetical protein